MPKKRILNINTGKSIYIVKNAMHYKPGVQILFNDPEYLIDQFDSDDQEVNEELAIARLQQIWEQLKKANQIIN